MAAPAAMNAVVGDNLLITSAIAPASSTAFAAVDWINGKMLAGIMLDASFSGTLLYPFNSINGTTFNQVYDSTGATVSWTASASFCVKFDPPLLGYSNLQLYSNTAMVATSTISLLLVP